jgi:hypothetical protein
MKDRVWTIDGARGTGSVSPYSMTLQEWLREARQIRAQLPKTGDAVEILRQLRERRAGR